MRVGGLGVMESGCLMMDCKSNCEGGGAFIAKTRVLNKRSPIRKEYLSQ